MRTTWKPSGKKTKLTSLLALTFLYLFLTGFSFGDFIDDLRFRGTNVGVNNCIIRNLRKWEKASPAEKKISEPEKYFDDFDENYFTEKDRKELIKGRKEIKKQCREKHSKLWVSPDKFVGGTAKINWASQAISVEIKNSSLDRIITSVTIGVICKGGVSDNGLLHVDTTRGIWIFPESTMEIWFEGTGGICVKDFDWSIREVKYVKFATE
tara:strand:- start:95 stop:724 length:630 start_codon:yes stop_codon:yes gene_type:complete